MAVRVTYLHLFLFCAGGFAQQSTSTLKLDTGKEIFEAACAGCHGPDGKGQPQTILGFQPPATFPDFADCPTASPEADIQWKAIITDGGKARAFSRIMPAFGDALTGDQIDKVVAYLRGLCDGSGYALAEFNIPRPLFAEKAFPEKETVLTTVVNDDGTGFQHTLLNEVRFGPRTNVEFTVPFSFRTLPVAGAPQRQEWRGGIGDIAFEFKRRIYTNRKTRTLIAAASEFNFPTGSVASGSGVGLFYPEPFISVEQLLPGRSFYFSQHGMRLPAGSSVPRRVFLRNGFGKTFASQGGLGRTYSPMVEWLGQKDFAAGNRMQWDIAPQMQISISQRQHVRLNVGVRVPVNNYNNRPVQIAFYLLWDWFDGSLVEGWR
jgi:mono/diheme cytochrome c family protein